MRLARLKEYLYVKKNCRKALRMTFDIQDHGILDIFVIAPKHQWNRANPYILIINGDTMMPIGVSWAVLLQRLAVRLEEYGSERIDQDNYEILVEEAMLDAKVIYPAMHYKEIRKEMQTLLNRIARQEKMVPIHRYHPIRSQKEYRDGFKKIDPILWMQKDRNEVPHRIFKVAQLNRLRKGV